MFVTSRADLFREHTMTYNSCVQSFITRGMSSQSHNGDALLLQV